MEDRVKIFGVEIDNLTLDEIAEKNREKIDNNITCEEVCYIPENSTKKEKIAKLKEIIEKLENES